MAHFTATYSFEGDEIFAIHEGKVIASGTDMTDVESEATKYLEAREQEFQITEKTAAKKRATHVITPNGLEGEILGRTPTLWGEEVTVRLANGNIHSFQTHGEDNVQWVQKNEKTAAAKGITAGLKATLDEDYAHDKTSLRARHAALNGVIATATQAIRNGAPYAEEMKLDEIVTVASYEAGEVKEALDHLEQMDAEAIESKPFIPQAAPAQADLGRGANDNWLDVTHDEMLKENEGQDFDKLLHEGPALFVTELETPALADAGTTREMALSHVMERTAGYVGQEVEDYRTAWVARAEVARRQELVSRKETLTREAAQVQETIEDAPDEALFM
jgi:hypothetical protein